MMLFFIIIQFILLLFMVFHDWIPLRPFNDIPALKRTDSYFYRLLGSAINGAIVLIPLALTFISYYNISSSIYINIAIFACYLILTVGTIFSWWVPYLFGSSQKLKQEFSKFKNTHHFLPAHRDHVVPNTLHVILHLQVWICFAMSIYFLNRG